MKNIKVKLDNNEYKTLKKAFENKKDNEVIRRIRKNGIDTYGRVFEVTIYKIIKS